MNRWLLSDACASALKFWGFNLSLQMRQQGVHACENVIESMAREEIFSLKHSKSASGYRQSDVERVKRRRDNAIRILLLQEYT